MKLFTVSILVKLARNFTLGLTLAFLNLCIDVVVFFLKLNFCFSIEECRNIIMQFGVREVTAAQVARVLGMMARTHSGLTDGIPLQVSVELSCFTTRMKYVLPFPLIFKITV